MFWGWGWGVLSIIITIIIIITVEYRYGCVCQVLVVLSRPDAWEKIFWLLYVYLCGMTECALVRTYSLGTTETIWYIFSSFGMCAVEVRVYLCLIKSQTVTSIISTLFIICIFFCFSPPDDDFSESTGYHCALPLEVHGAGYAQLQMISNTKAGKLVSMVKQTD